MKNTMKNKDGIRTAGELTMVALVYLGVFVAYWAAFRFAALALFEAAARSTVSLPSGIY